MTNSDINIDHYVILLSEHNVAEFNAILQFRPKNVHVVATDYVAKDKILERFEKAFQQHQDLENCQLHIIDNKGKFVGERVIEVEQWIENVFKPHCKKHFKENETTVLNYTGATKPISQLSTQAHPWGYLDYQAFRQTGKIYIDRSIIEENKIKSEREIESQSNIDVISYLNLYVDRIDKGKNTNSPIEQHELSLKIAQLRFDGQRLKEETDDNFFPIIIPVLNDLWYCNKIDEKFIKKSDDNSRFICQWGLFKCQNVSALKEFLKKIYLLDKKLQLFTINDDIIEIPTKENKETKYWVNWISGGWFEQLIYSWIIEIGFQPNKEIKTGLVPRIGNSGNETDIILFRNGTLSLMELKSDIPANKSPDEFRKQIIEHSQLGKLKSILVLSSIINTDRGINNDQKRSFIDKCESKNIGLIWAENKEQFQRELLKII